MIRPPEGMSPYMFAVLASLRAVQLMRGCVPRLDTGAEKATVIARMEVAAGRTYALSRDDDTTPSPAPEGA